jgi:hypothetical protein
MGLRAKSAKKMKKNKIKKNEKTHTLGLQVSVFLLSFSLWK